MTISVTTAKIKEAVNLMTGRRGYKGGIRQRKRKRKKYEIILAENKNNYLQTMVVCLCPRQVWD